MARMAIMAPKRAQRSLCIVHLVCTFSPGGRRNCFMSALFCASGRAAPTLELSLVDSSMSRIASLKLHVVDRSKCHQTLRRKIIDRVVKPGSLYLPVVLNSGHLHPDNSEV